LDLQLHVQLVTVTTKVVSSNPVHDEVSSIQHYVIKFVSDLRQVAGLLKDEEYIVRDCLKRGLSMSFLDEQLCPPTEYSVHDLVFWLLTKSH